MRRIVLFLLFVTTPTSLHASWWDTRWKAAAPQDKVRYVNIAGAGAILTWGVIHWDYFARSPHADAEGWFQHDTNNGGADKLGHLYVSHVTGVGLANLFENWGYDREQAARLGAWSSFGLMNLMELGDAFSRSYGFSYEDLVMNSLGSWWAYIRQTHPNVADRLDLRVEYSPGSDSKSDVFTDYENTRYLMALKLAGFPRLRHSWLRHLELHVGYYSRGYEDQTNARRYSYLGIGFNLSRWLEHRKHKKTGALLRFIQIPGTSLRDDHSLD